MYRWITSFLYHKMAKVKLDGSLSTEIRLSEEVPQRSVLSPTLFLLYVNDIVNTLPPSHKFARCWWAGCLDLCWTHLHGHTCHARDHQQSELLGRWVVHGHQLQQNTSNTLLALHCERESDVKAGKQVDNPTFQGVILDTRLMWKKHLEAVAARSIRQLGLLKILAGTTWGLHRSSLSHHGVCHNLLGHHFKCQQEQAGQSPKCPITSHCWCHKNNTHHGEGEQNRPGAPGTPKNI